MKDDLPIEEPLHCILLLYQEERWETKASTGLSMLRTDFGTSLWTGIVTIWIGNRSKWGLPFWDPSGLLLYASVRLIQTDLA